MISLLRHYSRRGDVWRIISRMDLQEAAPLLPGRTGRMAPLIFAAFAFTMLLMTPFLALYWYQTPFLGVGLEANNMVNQTTGRGWPANDAGVQAYDRLVRLGGQAVENPRQVID